MKYLKYLMFLPVAGCAALQDAVTANPDIVTDAVVAAEVGQTTSDWSSLLNILTVGGVPPYVTGPVAALLAFKRSRSHLTEAVKSVGKAAGLGHTK